MSCHEVLAISSEIWNRAFDTSEKRSLFGRIKYASVKPAIERFVDRSRGRRARDR